MTKLQKAIAYINSKPFFTYTEFADAMGHRQGNPVTTEMNYLSLISRRTRYVTKLYRTAYKTMYITNGVIPLDLKIKR